MKTKIDITEIMDDYADNEFFVEGEQVVDTEKAVSDLLGQVRPKKRTKPLLKVVAAAAAAVVLLAGTVTAVATLSTGGSFSTILGHNYEYETGDEGTKLVGEHAGDEITRYDSVLAENDGRLYITIGNETTDITDIADRQTPYIYSYINIETGMENYVIAGGTSEEYGVLDLTYIEGWGWEGSGALNGIDGNLIWFEVTPNPPDENGTIDNYLSYNIGLSYAKDENGAVYPLEEPYWPYHRHSACFNGEKYYYNDIPENWENECMDAWLIKALIQLEIIPEI